MEEGKKKERFFKRLSKNYKMQIKFCITSMIVLFVLYLPLSVWVDTINNRKMINGELSSDVTLFSNISEVKIENGQVNLLGWILKVDAKITGVTILLEASKGNSEILKTKLTDSNEVADYVNYLKLEDSTVGRGILASITENKLQQDVSYEICLNVDYETGQGETTKKVSTLQYLYNGNLYNYNPEDTITPAFKDKHMSEVIEKGYLCSYNRENGIWIYFYENDLYWILDSNLEWNQDENLYMFLHFYELDALLSGGFAQNEFDNKDFIFKNKELEFGQKEDYRVAKVKIEEGFQTAYLSTGYYDSTIGSRWSISFFLLPWM